MAVCPATATVPYRQPALPCPQSSATPVSHTPAPLAAWPCALQLHRTASPYRRTCFPYACASGCVAVWPARAMDHSPWLSCVALSEPRLPTTRRKDVFLEGHVHTQNTHICVPTPSHSHKHPGGPPMRRGEAGISGLGHRKATWWGPRHDGGTQHQHAAHTYPQPPHSRTCLHACIHVHIHNVKKPTPALTNIHTYTYIYTYIYMYAYIYTYI